MDTLPEDTKTTPPVETVSANPPAQSQNVSEQNTSTEKSWGDKYKVKTLSFTRNILVNYIVNFSISALGTYAVMESPFNSKVLEPAINWFVKTGNKVAESPGLWRSVGQFFTRTQILLCGGHILLPITKWTHDNKRHLEFTIGRRLDSLQEFFGQGNEASKRNLEEYKYIKNLQIANKPEDLTDADKALLGKNYIDDKLQFIEHRQTWKQVLKARGTGVAVTTTMGILFGFTKNLPKGFQMETIVNRAGTGISQHVLEPTLAHLPNNIINKPIELGKNIFLELIYTAGSKLGFDRMERAQQRKREAEERAEAEAQLSGNRKTLSDLGIRTDDADDIQKLRSASVPSAEDSRKKIIAAGAKDFRTRESNKAEPTMALQ